MEAARVHTGKGQPNAACYCGCYLFGCVLDSKQKSTQETQFACGMRLHGQAPTHKVALMGCFSCQTDNTFPAAQRCQAGYTRVACKRWELLMSSLRMRTQAHTNTHTQILLRSVSIRGPQIRGSSCNCARQGNKAACHQGTHISLPLQGWGARCTKTCGRPAHL